MLLNIPSVCCRTTLRKLEVRICGNLQEKHTENLSHLAKTETSRHAAE